MGNFGSPAAHETQLARQLLRELLSVRPRIGAQLRSALGFKLKAAGLDDHRFFRAYRNFRAFLTEQTDLINIEPRADGADVTVSLKDTTVETVDRVENLAAHVRYDLVKAFTNPDARRRRFFDRTEGVVHHYAELSTHQNDTNWRHRITQDPARFVEIEFATAEVQQRWMTEFLTATPSLSDHIRRTAVAFTQVPYDSALENAFAIALGPFVTPWKEFRLGKVSDLVRDWADRKGIPMARLLKREFAAPATPAPATGASATSLAVAGSVLAADALTPNTHGGADLATVLRTCSDEELSRVLIPASIVVRLLRERR